MSQASSMSGSESQIPTTPSIYATYLCREPADDVPLLIQNGPDEYTATMRTLQRSADYFADKDQVRSVERLQLEMARVHIKHDQWERAARVLTPLWQTLSWRKSGWWQMLEEVDWTLRDCATRIRNLETLIAVDWELLNTSLTARQEWDYGFARTLEPLRPLDSRSRSVLRAENILSCISATFAFSASEGNVGESLLSQVVISSRAHLSSGVLPLSQIRVAFEGELRNLTIQHESDARPTTSTVDDLIHIYNINLQKASPDAPSTPSRPVISRANHFANDMVGSADLRLSPGVTKIFSLYHIPREPGEVEVASVTLCLKGDDFDLEVLVTEEEQMHHEIFWLEGGTGPTQKLLKNGRSNAARILPKPPKMRLETHHIKSTYFADETIAIDLQITNEEQEEADIVVDARLLGPPEALPSIIWTTGEEGHATSTETATKNPLDQQKNISASKVIGILASSSHQRLGICIQATSEAAEYILETRARYHLLSDSETPIFKSLSTNLVVVLPFEVSYSFTPMIHPEPWPNYFDVSEFDHDGDAGEDGIANGLVQRWLLTSRIYSLADITLSIESVEPKVLEIHEGAICKISPGAEDVSELSLISPKDLQERSFALEAQKIDLEDRRSTFLGLRLEVRWRRDDSQRFFTVTHLTVPELDIPFGEPRVLATARNGKTPLGVIHLEYIIENPSMYVLTFNLTMETSEEFAFSGAKNVAMELLPISRHTVRYNLMPLVKGAWISPQFRVFDTHFHKNLKVNATEGMRSDKKGVSIWVDVDG